MTYHARDHGFRCGDYVDYVDVGDDDDTKHSHEHDDVVVVLLKDRDDFRRSLRALISVQT